MWFGRCSKAFVFVEVETTLCVQISIAFLCLQQVFYLLSSIPGNFQFVYSILVKFPSFIPKIKCTRFTYSTCISHTIPHTSTFITSCYGRCRDCRPCCSTPGQSAGITRPVSTQWKHVLQEITRVLLMIQLKPCWNSQLTIQNGQDCIVRENVSTSTVVIRIKMQEYIVHTVDSTCTSCM